MKHHLQSRSPRNAFTLIELLVVITIIAILASIAFTGFNAAMRAAKKVQDLNACTSIAQAVGMYQTEYSVLPLLQASVAGAVDGDPGKVETGPQWVMLASALNGLKNPYNLNDATGSVNGLNPRAIQFMSFKKTDVSAAGDIGAPKSAFKNAGADQLFYLRMDANYDGVVDDVADLTSKTGNVKMAGSCFVWSKCDNTNGADDHTKWTGNQK